MCRTAGLCKEDQLLENMMGNARALEEAKWAEWGSRRGYCSQGKARAWSLISLCKGYWLLVSEEYKTSTLTTSPKPPKAPPSLCSGIR